LDSGDGREICFLTVQVYNGIQHHNALFFNGFDAMLSNIGHGGSMVDCNGGFFSNHHGQSYEEWRIFGFFCHPIFRDFV